MKNRKTGRKGTSVVKSLKRDDTRRSAVDSPKMLSRYGMRTAGGRRGRR